MLTLGNSATKLKISLVAGQDFIGRIQYQDPPGIATPWPAGLAAWLRFTTRHGFEAIWPATITGPLMEWLVSASVVEDIPHSAWAELWLEYPTDPAFVWVEGPISTCGPVGFGCPVAVPGPDAAAIAVPVPGPQGPPGTGSGGSQVVLTGEAAVPLSGHRAVYRRPDGLIDYASATSPGHISAPIWITTGAAGAGTTVTMLALGELTEGSWSWTPGPIFLGATGALVQALPPGAAFLAVLAAASSATTVFVDRQPSIDLI